MNDNEHVRIAVTLSEVMNYAQYQNGIRTIKSIIISSDSTESIRDMVLKVSCDDGIIRSDEIGVNELSPESDLEIKDFDISVNASELAEITERITVDLLFELKTQDTVIASLSKKITVLAYDEWQGLSYSPELITAFITPNEAHISKILSRASVYLNNWTSDPSFNAYQTSLSGTGSCPEKRASRRFLRKFYPPSFFWQGLFLRGPLWDRRLFASLKTRDGAGDRPACVR